MLIEADETWVRDSDAVGVAGEVLENLFGAGPRGSDIDVPLLLTKRGDEVSEGAGVMEMFKFAEDKFGRIGMIAS